MDHPSETLQPLRNQIKEADWYLPITPEYNRSTSSAMKNTLDYFLRNIISNHYLLFHTLQEHLAESMQLNNFDLYSLN